MLWLDVSTAYSDLCQVLKPAPSDGILNPYMVTWVSQHTLKLTNYCTCVVNPSPDSSPSLSMNLSKNLPGCFSKAHGWLIYQELCMPTFTVCWGIWLLVTCPKQHRTQVGFAILNVASWLSTSQVPYTDSHTETTFSCVAVVGMLWSWDKHSLMHRFPAAVLGSSAARQSRLADRITWVSVCDIPWRLQRQKKLGHWRGER